MNRKWVKYCLLGVLIMISANLNAQLYVGYGIGSGDFDGINNAIDQWNTDFILVEEFENLDQAHVLTAKYGTHVGGSPFYTEFGFTFNTRTLSSTFNSTIDGERNEVQLRYLRFIFHGGLGYRVINSQAVSVTPGVSLGMDLPYVDIRSGTVDEVDDVAWIKGVQELQYSTELFVQFDFRKLLAVSPYILLVNDLDISAAESELGTNPPLGTSEHNQVGVRIFLRLFD